MTMTTALVQREQQRFRLPALRARREPVAGCRAPIRVCFMIDELTPAGTETQLVALIRNLNRARVQPYLCLLRETMAPSRLLELAPCPVYCVGLRSFRRVSTLGKAWRLGRFFRRERIDVLQVYFPESLAQVKYRPFIFVAA